MKAVEHVKKVVVFGDFMIDSWRTVLPTKVSPEAPVLVTKHRFRQTTPGGAGNAAVNCKHLGATVSAVGLRNVGENDPALLLQEYGIPTALVLSTHWVNIVKERVIDTEGRHMLRIDTEDQDYYMNEHRASQLRSSLINAIASADVLFISDYGKGTCDERVLRGLKLSFKFTIANGKPENLCLYSDVDCLVINRLEAMQIAESTDVQLTPYDLAPLVRSAGFTGKHLVITDGFNGLYWFVGELKRHVKAPKVAVADVAGAGDTICAAIAAHGKVTLSVLHYAVEAAALVVSQHGTAVPTLEKQ